jgi:hypothetical protein
MNLSTFFFIESNLRFIINHNDNDNVADSTGIDDDTLNDENEEMNSGNLFPLF